MILLLSANRDWNGNRTAKPFYLADPPYGKRETAGKARRATWCHRQGQAAPEDAHGRGWVSRFPEHLQFSGCFAIRRPGDREKDFTVHTTGRAFLLLDGPRAAEAAPQSHPVI
jgi:hypothetical protein